MTPAADPWPADSALVASAHDAIIGETLGGLIASWNAAAENLFGWPANEVLGKPVARLTGPALEESQDLKEPYEAVVQAREGHRIAVSVSTSPVLGPDGNRIGRSHIVRRLASAATTDERGAQLAQLSRLGLMGQLAPLLAHELKQPLTAIVNYLTPAHRLLQTDKVVDPRSVGAALEGALGQARRADQIIRHLRSFARDEWVEREQVDIATMIAEACDLALIPARVAGVTVRCVAESTATVFVDRVQVQQVLFNLMRNAIEAMAGGPVRELRTAVVRIGDNILVSVTDTGPGLAPDVAARLFEPFVTTKPDGMGLGLSICRRIVERHGGRLWFEPGARDGLVACFTLPLALMD